MRTIVVGATGTLGQATVSALKQNHEIIKASRKEDIRVDLSIPESIKKMYAQVSDIDAVVCTAGDATFGPFASFSDDDFVFSLGNKLMGQINLVRYGGEHINTGGVFTLTTGVLAHSPNAATVMLTMINRGLEAFVIRLSRKCAEIVLDEPMEILTNLKMNLRDVDENLAIKSFYGKVIEYPGKNEKIHMVRFTSVPSEVDACFQSHRQHATKLQPT